MTPTSLFVYGTLREAFGHPMHAALATRAQCIGKGFVRGELYDLGDYPGLFPSFETDRRTFGEVYRFDPESEVEALSLLDAYEGCGPHDRQPHEYVRKIVPCHLKEGSALEVWTYVLNRCPEWATLIPGGDYLAWKALKFSEAELV